VRTRWLANSHRLTKLAVASATTPSLDFSRRGELLPKALPGATQSPRRTAIGQEESPDGRQGQVIQTKKRFPGKLSVRKSLAPYNNDGQHGSGRQEQHREPGGARLRVGEMPVEVVGRSRELLDAQ